MAKFTRVGGTVVHTRIWCLLLAGHEDAVVTAKAVSGDASADMVHYRPGKGGEGLMADFARH